MEKPEEAGHPVGQRFAEARTERGWSQNAAARRLHVSGSTLSRIEAGLAWPDLDVILNAARLYGKPAMWFVDPDWDGDEIKRVGDLDVVLYDRVRAYPLAQQRALADYLPALDDYVTKVTGRR